MPSPFEQARTHADLLISVARDQNGGRLTVEMIEEQVDRVINLVPDWRETVDRGRLIRELEASNATWIGQASVLVDPDERHQPWLEQAKAELSWEFRERYKLFLASQNWARATRDELDRSTDQVLNLLTDPRLPGSWDRRGLVVGHVQSGKTAHYIGLICKAVDAGYKLIVVLSGMHKSLRSQTQIRLEEGFLGYDISAARARRADRAAVRSVGAGLLRDVRIRPDTITSRLDNGDFSRQVANGFAIHPGSAPLLFVVKKNGRVLANLLEWIEWAGNRTDERGRHYVAGVPLLVIDDESDQASVDTNEIPLDENGEPDVDHSPTIINQRIRKLLNSFEQSAYVGFTATPFANIFIHERARTEEHGEDLFPRSFILSLSAPSDYVGAARIFGLRRDNDPNAAVEALPIIREVRDHAATTEPNEREGWMPPKHRIDHIPLYEGNDVMPPSLRGAIHSFLLATAARRVRGQSGVHNSMLIHVARFNAVQERVARQVEQELAVLADRVRHGEGHAGNRAVGSLRRLWETDFVPTTERANAILGGDAPATPWSEILHQLRPVIESIHLRRVNGTAGDTLEYKKYETSGLNVIAVGGDKLSRGLTLEGLTVSYFLRASRMYDTLMQMSRWFGYRPGYVDLCRLYTTHELLEWFEHIAVASEELREEFDRMVTSGGTPRDYGLRVRAHPQMLVTSRVKMRTGTPVDLSFDGDVSETVVFHRDPAGLRRNLRAVEALIERMRAAGCRREVSPERPRPRGGTHRWNSGVVWTDVDARSIIGFLEEYQTHPGGYRVNTTLLREYIEKQVEVGDLSSWTVLLTGGQSQRTHRFDGVEVPLVQRSWHGDQFRTAEERATSDRFVIRRLVSPRDEAVDMDAEAYARALEQTVETWHADPARSENRDPPDSPAGWAVRHQRPKANGLLLIYPVDPAPDMTQEGADGPPLMGMAMSFPGNPDARKVRYIVNNIYYSQELGVGQ